MQDPTAFLSLCNGNSEKTACENSPELKAACSTAPSSLPHIGDMWGMKHGLCFNLIESDHDKRRDCFFILQGKFTGIKF